MNDVTFWLQVALLSHRPFVCVLRPGIFPVAFSRNSIAVTACLSNPNALDLFRRSIFHANTHYENGRVCVCVPSRFVRLFFPFSLLTMVPKDPSFLILILQSDLVFLSVYKVV